MLIILAFLDLLSALVLILLAFGMAINFIVIPVAAYLAVKGLLFLKDFASIVDLIIAAVLVTSLFLNVPAIILMIMAVFLIQKSFMSLLG